MREAVITRFAPSCNGPLHLGHVANLLVNEYFAHSRGGKFLVRFDDLTYTYIKGIGFDDPCQIQRIREEQRRDIEWLGVEVDEWFSDAEWFPRVREVWSEHGFPEPPYYMECGPRFIQHPTLVVGQYTPWNTAVRAVIDGETGATHLIRGEDLAPECYLHQWFLVQFGYPRPEYIFLPRLQAAEGDVSKTNGGHTIADCRGRGMSPANVREVIASACLKVPVGAWSLDNLKSRPVLR